MTITGMELPFYLLLGIAIGWIIRAWWDKKDNEQPASLLNKNSG